MSRHAYLITAYNDPFTLRTLMRLLDDERNAVFVHLDARFDVDERVLAQTCAKSPVTFVKRTKVHWGDFSQIAAILRLFTDAVTGRFDYYHVISGSDLPLKTQDEIHDYFDRHAGKEFIGYANEFDPSWVTELHFFNRYMRPANRLQRAIRKWGTDNLIAVQRHAKYDHTRRFDLELRKGSDWFSITHSLALHLLDHERSLRSLLRFAHIPTEFYMQTLAWNSEYRDRLFDPADEYAGSARLIDWERGGPYVFEHSDLRQLITSDRMFARKFVSSVDRDVIVALADHVAARSKS